MLQFCMIRLFVQINFDIIPSSDSICGLRLNTSVISNARHHLKSEKQVILLNLSPVSYTHLTLPTNREV